MSYYSHNQAFQVNDEAILNESQPPSYSSIFANNLNLQNESDSNQTVSNSVQNSKREQQLHQFNLFQHSSEPLSYTELFNTNIENENIFGSQSNRYYPSFDDPIPGLMGTSQPALSYSRSNNNNYNNRRRPNRTNTNNNQLIKQLHKHYSKTYIIRHSIFVSIASLILIIFQIYLMTNQTILSHMASGIWAGLVNLIVIIASLITSKFNVIFNIILLK